ncbi:hypothetical protein WR25_22338 [Diploscapter pachys]|uniref:Uncharacterized protein n=1 Tax=Diploscapter pachys TaxID=2018661 RepID=A0A2A2M4K5_9BILA|nr:hypothetical protein WR25_22338 [Diploscapter pachys]
MTIDDPAAPRGDHRQVDAVAFGQKVVFLVLGDREIAHAAGEHDADGALRGAEQPRPAREAVCLHRFGDDPGGTLHAVGPRLRSIQATRRADRGNSITEIMVCANSTVSTCAPMGTAIQRPIAVQKTIAPLAISQSCQKSRVTRRCSINSIAIKQSDQSSIADPSGWPLTRSSNRPSGAAAQGRMAASAAGLRPPARWRSASMQPIR